MRLTCRDIQPQPLPMSQLLQRASSGVEAPAAPQAQAATPFFRGLPWSSTRVDQPVSTAQPAPPRSTLRTESPAPAKATAAPPTPTEGLPVRAFFASLNWSNRAPEHIRVMPAEPSAEDVRQRAIPGNEPPKAFAPQRVFRQSTGEFWRSLPWQGKSRVQTEAG